MARPKSEDKRNAILAAAIRVIVTQGLSAPTAAIAKEAGVANGSLFTYFETKAALYNELYLELKTEMAAAASQGLSEKAAPREQLARVWTNWMNWAVSHPEKRKVLAQLVVSEEVTPDTRALAMAKMATVGALFERIIANSTLREAPKPFVANIINVLAEATMDYMIGDPPHASSHCEVGFDALWRIVS